MTTPQRPETIEAAEAERDRLAAASRAAADRADALAAAAWERREARRRAWAEKVVADHPAEEARRAAAETSAAAAFRLAAVEGDARPAYFAWMAARSAANVQRDRIATARGVLGAPQSDSGYRFRDQPRYSAELDRALGSEASARSGALAEALQREINALDELP